MVEKITNHRRFYIFSNLMAALLFKLQRNIDERFQKNLMVFSLKGTNFREFVFSPNYCSGKIYA